MVYRTYQGTAVPLSGAFQRTNESQTAVWTVEDNGRLLLSVGDTSSTVVYGMEIDLDTTIINSSDQHALLLKRSSTKAGTTRDSFVHMELGATTAVVTSCLDVGSATVATRPAYFLTVASSAVSANCAGFVDEIMVTARTSASPMVAFKCLVGTTSVYIPAFHATNTATTAAQ
jgi:hypothetical protein